MTDEVEQNKLDDISNKLNAFEDIKAELKSMKEERLQAIEVSFILYILTIYYCRSRQLP